MRTSEISLTTNGQYWLARWTDDNGRHRGKSLGNKAKVSRRQAIQKCRALAQQHARRPGLRNLVEAMTLSDWLDQFRQLTPTYSEATRKMYDQAGALLVEHFTGARCIDKISRQDAGMFRAWLNEYTYARDAAGKNRRKLTETTIRKHIRHCKVIFAEAVKRDHLIENPFDREVGAVPRVDKTWRYISMNDLDDLLSACPDQSWRCLFALCRLAGLRLGEAMRLAWADVDHDKRMITVKHEGQATTKRRRRTVPIVPRLQTELLRAFEAAAAGDDRVVRVGRTNLYRKADIIVKRAELGAWRKPFHTLRKNCESDWLAEYPVMDVCDWMGHDPAVASKHYHQTGKDVIADVTGRKQQEQHAR